MRHQYRFTKEALCLCQSHSLIKRSLCYINCANKSVSLSTQSGDEHMGESSPSSFVALLYTCASVHTLHITHQLICNSHNLKELLNQLLGCKSENEASANIVASKLLVARSTYSDPPWERVSRLHNSLVEIYTHPIGQSFIRVGTFFFKSAIDDHALHARWQGSRFFTHVTRSAKLRCSQPDNAEGGRDALDELPAPNIHFYNSLCPTLNRSWPIVHGAENVFDCTQYMLSCF